MTSQVVLVGCDGSKTSLVAVEKAAQVAAERNARLLVVSAYLQATEREREKASRDLGDELAYQVLGSHVADEALEEAKGRAKKAASDVDVETVSKEGKPLEVLAEVADEHDVDLVVVGNVGRRGLAGRLTGSVPEGISRHIRNRQVLVVETASAADDGHQ